MGKAFIFIPFAGWERPGFHLPSTEIGSLASEAVVPSAGKPGPTPPQRALHLCHQKARHPAKGACEKLRHFISCPEG